jgi:hypothetical protein
MTVLRRPALQWRIRERSPNPSIERTPKSRPRYSTSSLLLPRGLLSVAAHVKR